MYETVYEDRNGVPVSWESVKRKKTTPGVVIIAKLVPSRQFILIKQFRHAVGGYVLSFPAGLADGDPRHALVELKEETGYIGRIVSVSPVLKTGSTIVDDSGQTVYIEVDEKDPANLDPRQDLEPGEDIEVCLVRRDEIKKYLMAEQGQGTHISANLWYLFVLRDEIL